MNVPSQTVSRMLFFLLYLASAMMWIDMLDRIGATLPWNRNNTALSEVAAYTTIPLVTFATVVVFIMHVSSDVFSFRYDNKANELSSTSSSLSWSFPSLSIVIEMRYIVNMCSMNALPNNNQEQLTNAYPVL